MLDEKSKPARAGFTRLDSTQTNTSLVAVPEKAALSNTTICGPMEATPRTSQESSTKGTPFGHDLEAGIETHNSHELINTTTRTQTKQQGDCQVWPNKEHWKRKAKLAKAKNRNCNLMSKMSRRNRIITKIIIMFFIIGIAVAIGFGISKPLGAPIWGDKTRGD